MFIPFSQITVPKGITSVIGSGGKTSLLRYMAATLPGTVILTTTTHILPFADIPLILTDSRTADTDSRAVRPAYLQQVRQLLSGERVICIGSPAENGKLSAPDVPFSSLLAEADYILVEADGSRSLPLKAHRSSEPVIPPGSSLTICLAGASGIGKRICDVCHCPSIFSSLAETSPEEPAVPERIAAVLNREDLADLYFVNQADLAESPESVLSLCNAIKKPAAAGSLLHRTFFS